MGETGINRLIIVHIVCFHHVKQFWSAFEYMQQTIFFAKNDGRIPWSNFSRVHLNIFDKNIIQDKGDFDIVYYRETRGLF